MERLSGLASLYAASRGRQHADERLGADDLRSLGGARRDRRVRRHPALHRRPRAPRRPVPPPPRDAAAGDRPAVLGRRPRIRHRVPRPPHRAAQARRLAAAVHAGRAAARASARPQPPVVGVLRHRGARQHPGAAAGKLRAVPEDALRRAGRRARDAALLGAARARSRRARVAAEAPPLFRPRADAARPRDANDGRRRANADRARAPTLPPTPARWYGTAFAARERSRTSRGATPTTRNRRPSCRRRARASTSPSRRSASSTACAFRCPRWSG